mgnify:CR=1 FL=1
MKFLKFFRLFLIIVQMISTGLAQLDEFLLGGIHNSTITDIYGANGTGKTQLLLQICINSIKDGGAILYLDTTGNFRPERVLEMDDHATPDLLDKITVLRITNTSEQINSIDIMKKQNFSLVVIDNITDLFSYEYQNDELVNKKNMLFMTFMHQLSLLAISQNIPVVVTNMIRSIDGKEMENMKSAIDLFTHFKIRLSRISSKFRGEVRWLEHHANFTYKIGKKGLVPPEDI